MKVRLVSLAVSLTNHVVNVDIINLRILVYKYFVYNKNKEE